MDSNKNCLVEPDEFFDFPELKDNPIVARIINVFDKNGDGKISYDDFCAFTKDIQIQDLFSMNMFENNNA